MVSGLGSSERPTPGGWRSELTSALASWTRSQRRVLGHPRGPSWPGSHACPPLLLPGGPQPPPPLGGSWNTEPTHISVARGIFMETAPRPPLPPAVAQGQVLGFATSISFVCPLKVRGGFGVDGPGRAARASLGLAGQVTAVGTAGGPVGAVAVRGACRSVWLTVSPSRGGDVRAAGHRWPRKSSPAHITASPVA